MEIYERIGDRKGIGQMHGHIGMLYYKQGRYTEALSEQLQGLESATEIGRPENRRKHELALVDTYSALGDFRSALAHHQSYHKIENEIMGSQAQKELARLSFQHDMEVQEKELNFEKKERELTQTLLLNILPAEVAEELKAKGSAEARLYDDVTVLFTDFVGFTTASERMSPQQLVDELHTCFSAFDDICVKHGVEKIKTVGDAYLAISGLPSSNPNHASDMLQVAIEIRDYMARRFAEHHQAFQIRIGMHSGSVVAGIVGVRKFAYDIWGDTVNTAARMEQNSEAGKINISEATYVLVSEKFPCLYRGEIEAKNKGKLKMYFVE
jgi:class 3 adenylate cyclase